MQQMEQIEQIIDALKKILNSMKLGKVNGETLSDVDITAKEINRYLYHTEVLQFQKRYNMENDEEYLLYISELERLIEIWQQSFQHRNQNKVDAEFWELYEFFKYVDVQSIFQMVVSHFLSLPEAQRVKFRSVNQEYPFLQYKIDETQNDYSLIKQHVETLVNQIEQFRWLYEHLEDYRSKIVFNGVLRYWFEFDEKKLHGLNEEIYFDYYDLDIIQCDNDVVAVDLGAYVGEDVLHFIQTYQKYQKIYAYEITPSTYQKLQQNVLEYENVIPVNKGVSGTPGTMYVSGREFGAANKLSDGVDEDSVLVEVVTLDEDIKEHIGVIKMDIEGAEKDAIRGAIRHIQQEKPMLAISAYHYPEDLVEISKLIREIRDDYKFYLRYNGRKVFWPCDYILFAV